jgi:hypothetical protein
MHGPMNVKVCYLLLELTGFSFVNRSKLDMHLLLCVFSIVIVTENKEMVLGRTQEPCFSNTKNL